MTRSRLELARTLLLGGERLEAQQVGRAGLAVARSIGMVQVADEPTGLLDGSSRR